MKWYVINDSGTTYKILLDHNILKNTTLNIDGTRNCSTCAETLLASNTTEWKSTPKLISVSEINYLTGIDVNKIEYYSFGLSPTVYYKDYDKQNDAQKARQRSFHWLFDNLSDCIAYGCDVQDNNAGSAYWTTNGTSSKAYFVHNIGAINSGQPHATDWGGVRPVIEVPKNIF